MPEQIKEYISTNGNYKKCCVDKNCAGRITMEHALVYAGQQVQERWAVIPLCWHHHLGQGLVKDFNRWVALNRLFRNPEWLAEAQKKYPKAIVQWKQQTIFLNKKYGTKLKRGFDW